MVIGPESPHGHVTQKYTNFIIGRYTNRVPVGTHPLERHGIKSNFTALPNGVVKLPPSSSVADLKDFLFAENKFVSLHGGLVGFDAIPWTLLSEGDPPCLFSTAEVSNLKGSSESHAQLSHAFFRLISASWDQGFPGKLVTEALIGLIGPIKSQDSVTHIVEESIGSIVLVYRSKLDEGTTKVVTPVNLTQVRLWPCLHYLFDPRFRYM